MYQIDFTQPIHVHFIGIGGISMSGLAAILLDRSFSVTGSDSKKSELTTWLTGLGAQISIPQSAANISEDIALVVYTAAIHPDNPEFAAAVSKGIPMMTRAELLGQLMNNYPLSVAVSGTHGKTTTTSMLSHIMMAEGFDPTISVGGILPAIGGNVRVGNSDYFLTEACEYTNSFLHLSPMFGLILNIDADHLDFFKDLDDIRHSFRLFAEKIPANGTLIIHANVPELDVFTDGLRCRVVTFGTGCGNYHAENITWDDHGCASFDLYVRSGKKTAGEPEASNVSGNAADIPEDSCPDIQKDTLLGHFSLRVPGEHNIGNAAAAIACADLLGVSPASMEEGFSGFTGTDRRFQIKGEIGGVTVIDDYAHHPTEIRATLRAAQKYALAAPIQTENGSSTVSDADSGNPSDNASAGRIWCVFQPHTYSRTKALLDGFVDALTLADKIVLADIYAARETDTLGVSSELIREKLEEKSKEAWYFPTFDEIETFLMENCLPGDLLITMGAGDVYMIGESLLGMR